jgi:hypothetical protein
MNAATAARREFNMQGSAVRSAAHHGRQRRSHAGVPDHLWSHGTLPLETLGKG